jgi:hypothetical protein
MKTKLLAFTCLLVGCGGKHAATTTPSGAASPGATGPAAGEVLATDDTMATLSGGRAQLALVALPGPHAPVAVRATVDGKVSELFTVATGDCGGGNITGLSSAGDAVIVVLGQMSYSDCDDETEGDDDADIDSHVECARLTWSPATSSIEVQRSEPVAYEGDLPAWCRGEGDADASAATGDDVCCDTDVDGPEWHHRTECEVNDWAVLPAGRCPE